ncbi:elongation factor P-like [Salvia splendens]|uniref:elongation factor P-like n=1 Tax=Salvia splendens TaxID=180675 RepID=UPI001C261261|nr:elongation factor P-like [Salvia splendens]
MRLLTKRLAVALRSYAAAAHGGCRNFSASTARIKSQPLRGGLLESPWLATQFRGARFSGGDVKPGNHIERRGKIYEVIKAQHTTQGRGGAIIQVELRDVDSGNKLNERLRTDEKVEQIYVVEKSFEYLYTNDGDNGSVVLMDPESYEQLEVQPHLFGESLVFLQDGMKVSVQLYDDRPLSAKLPKTVTCTVAEAAEARKGSGTPPYKRALLDNGLTVQVPSHIATGEKVIINTTNNSYVSRI